MEDANEKKTTYERNDSERKRQTKNTKMIEQQQKSKNNFPRKYTVCAGCLITDSFSCYY